MLVLSRKVGERIRIGEDVTILFTRVAGGRVSVGIEAPAHMRILRGELEPFSADSAGSEVLADTGGSPSGISSIEKVTCGHDQREYVSKNS